MTIKEQIEDINIMSKLKGLAVLIYASDGKDKLFDADNRSEVAKLLTVEDLQNA